MTYLEYINQYPRESIGDYTLEHHIWLRQYSDEVVYFKSWDQHVVAHKLFCETPPEGTKATDIQRADAFHFITINPRYNVSDDMKELSILYMSKYKSGNDCFTKYSRSIGIQTRKLNGSYKNSVDHLQTQDNYNKIAAIRKLNGSYSSLDYPKVCINCGYECFGGSSKRKCPKCNKLTLKGR